MYLIKYVINMGAKDEGHFKSETYFLCTVNKAIW